MGYRVCPGTPKQSCQRGGTIVDTWTSGIYLAMSRTRERDPKRALLPSGRKRKVEGFIQGWKSLSGALGPQECKKSSLSLY